MNVRPSKSARGRRARGGRCRSRSDHQRSACVWSRRRRRRAGGRLFSGVGDAAALADGAPRTWTWHCFPPDPAGRRLRSRVLFRRDAPHRLPPRLQILFQRPPHRLARQRIHQFEIDHLVGQQLQRPAAAALGPRRARQRRDVRLQPTVDFARRQRPRHPLQGRLRTFQHRLPAPVLQAPLRHPDRPHRSGSRSSQGRLIRGWHAVCQAGYGLAAGGGSYAATWCGSV